MALLSRLASKGPLWKPGHHNPRHTLLALLRDVCRNHQFCSASAQGSVKQLSPTSTLLRNLKTGAEIYVIGTAHISEKSSLEVRKMIQLIQPNAVMLELCAMRLKKLQNLQESPSFLKDVFSNLGLPGGLQASLVKAGLSGMYGLLRSLGLEPGGEFKAGIEEAEKIGAQIICGDQDQEVTVKRIAENITLQDVLKMMSSPPESFKSLGPEKGFRDQIEALKTREGARQASDAIRQINPNLASAVIDERDEVLTASLLRIDGKGVGVVGLAHLEGIERNWREDMEGK